MFKTFKWRITLILGILAVCAWSLHDNYRQQGSIVRLGLDLSGGMHLLLEVDDPDGGMTAEARSDAIHGAEHVIRGRIDALGISEPIVQKVGADRLIVEIAGVEDEQQAREVIGRTALLEWKLLRPFPVLEGPLAPLGERLLSSGRPGEAFVAAEDLPVVRPLLESPEVMAALPRGVSLHLGSETVQTGAGPVRPVFAVDRDPLLTGAMLEDATATRDPDTNFAVVSFELSRAGGSRFWEVTGRHMGDRLAIVLDGEVVSAPYINARIGSRGVIELNHARMDEARELALLLRAGALPAPLRIVEERTVGPSLGRESVREGFRAGIVGLALVVVVMLARYGTDGTLAVTALGAYVLLLLGALAVLGATLTLPGLAGIVLSIGMAVDANVLVFERIREELAEGRRRRAAIETGFSKALSAIVDANVTTLITALILFQVGTGPVRGFAVTLSLGIMASFFTAVFVTRTLLLPAWAPPGKRRRAADSQNPRAPVNLPP